MGEFRKELQSLIDQCLRKADHSSPDFILAQAINSVIVYFERVMTEKDKWSDRPRRSWVSSRGEQL